MRGLIHEQRSCTALLRHVMIDIRFHKLRLSGHYSVRSAKKISETIYYRAVETMSKDVVDTQTIQVEKHLKTSFQSFRLMFGTVTNEEPLGGRFVCRGIPGCMGSLQIMHLKCRAIDIWNRSLRRRRNE